MQFVEPNRVADFTANRVAIYHGGRKLLLAVQITNPAPITIPTPIPIASHI